MSTVKIKTEPTAAATATAVDEVQVKLEPSLSTADIKLEQHALNVDTKVEPDLEADNDIKSESDDDSDDGEDTDQGQATDTPNNQRQRICEYSGCGRSFKKASGLRMHLHEHRLQTKLNVLGKTFTLTRQSLDDRWSCPFPDCTSTIKSVNKVRDHTHTVHKSTIKQQQQSPAIKTRYKLYFLSVDNFHVHDVRCGYHTTTGLFFCHECRVVPECLLTHLQQKHGYDKKLIDNSVLPDSARINGSDSNGNQYTSNSHLASAIRQPHWQQHPDIVQGWLCVTSDCGYCGYSTQHKNKHKRNYHKDEPLTTIAALVLRLIYSKAQTSYFLITRLDTTSNKSSYIKQVYQHGKHEWNDDEGEDYIRLDDHLEDNGDTDHNQDTKSLKDQRQLICNHPGCGRSLNSATDMRMHQREHRLYSELRVFGKKIIMTRQSLDDRWACPIPDCEMTLKTVNSANGHIRTVHESTIKQQQQLQQPPAKKTRRNHYFVDVDDFYVNEVRCGYHNAIGVFICQECRLVPESLLMHLQQKHGYDEKSIDKSTLPESAVNASADPNINQHTSNSLLTSAIRDPYQWYHRDIVQGWLCVTSNCGYCDYTTNSKRKHQSKEHRGKRLSTAPALVLKLHYAKTLTCHFLLTRLDTIASNIKSTSSASQQRSECDGEEDDGDELVLSDYSD